MIGAVYYEINEGFKGSIFKKIRTIYAKNQEGNIYFKPRVTITRR
jgi:hypothetical protein